MAHPGFGFTRRSYHTLKNLSCPRKAYYNQILELRRRSMNGQPSGPLASGKVFHSLLELHYTPQRLRGTPLPGTDGNPSPRTPEEVRDWYLNLNYDAASVCEAYEAYQRYVLDRGVDEEITARLVGRPEPNVEGDLRDLLNNKRMRKIPYAAQYDAVIRNPPDGPKGVISVEHKLLATYSYNTLKSYLSSGQLIGQCAVWNSREDLVELFGPMTQVMLNLTFKRPSKENPVYTHRTTLYVPMEWQLAYARAVSKETAKLETLMRQMRKDDASPHPKGAALWPQSGMVHGECVQWSFSCDYVEICQDGAVEPELYQITEAARARAATETGVRVSPHLEVYEP